MKKYPVSISTAPSIEILIRNENLIWIHKKTKKNHL